MRITNDTINLPDKVLAEMWNDINWQSMEEKVLKWQKLLSIAAFKKNSIQIRDLSARIVSSIEAKVLAVHKVSEILNSTPRC